MTDETLPGFSDDQRRALVERLSQVDKDPGWTLRFVRMGEVVMA